MENRRLLLIAGLGVVELWIVGTMIHSVEGRRSHETAFSMPPAHLSVGSPAEAATDGRVAKILETGPLPHVVIDDDDATLTVSARTGTTVEVSEETQLSGWVQGSRHPLDIEKTADGVRISRGGGGLVISMGQVRRRLDVVVPPGTRLDVENAGTTTVAGLAGAASLHSDDGSIIVTGARGDLAAKTDNGRIELTDVVAPSLDAASDNGRILLDRVRSDQVSIVTDNGRIEVGRSVLRGGKIQTDSGRIRLGLDQQSDVTVSAHTSSGKVTAEAPLTVAGSGDEDAPSTIRVGSGAGHLEVGSDNGSITVLAGGV